MGKHEIKHLKTPLTRVIYMEILATYSVTSEVAHVEKLNSETKNSEKDI